MELKKRIPKAESKLLIELARTVTKLREESEFNDWRDKLIGILQLCGLENLLDITKVVEKPSFVKPTFESLRSRIRGLDAREREKLANDVKNEQSQWSDYEKYKTLSVFVFIIIITTIDDKSEAYADVRTNKEQSPSKILDDLSRRFQPKCAEAEVK